MKIQRTENREQRTESKTGFTLFELVITIVIAAVILIPTSIIVVESLRNTFLPEYLTVASSLLEDRIEWLTNLRFNAVDNVDPPISFGGDFNNYYYQATITYVEHNVLNTPVGYDTDYKRAQITISRSGFPDVSGTTLRTNN